MRYLTTAKTHKGISRTTNQDCVLIRHEVINKKEVVLAAICDGVGGLSKGEVASQLVIGELSNWFEENVNEEVSQFNPALTGLRISMLVKALNLRILNIGNESHEKLGTTLTCIFLVNEQYTCVHVGDTRLYEIGNDISQLTTDHSLAERQNVLLQCIGATESVEPQVFSGEFIDNFFLLCSDGFRHKLKENEIVEFLAKSRISSNNKLGEVINQMIELNMKRREKDNISAILIKKKKAMGRKKGA